MVYSNFNKQAISFFIYTYTVLFWDVTKVFVTVSQHISSSDYESMEILRTLA